MNADEAGRLEFSDQCIISPKPKGLSDETVVADKTWKEIKEKDYYSNPENEWQKNLNNE